MTLGPLEVLVPSGDDYPGTPDWQPSEGDNLWSLIDQGIYTPDDDKYIRAQDEDTENFIDFTDPIFLGTSNKVRAHVRMRSTDITANIEITPYIGVVQVGITLDVNNTVDDTWEVFATDWWPIQRTAAELTDLNMRVNGFAASTIDISEIELEVEALGGFPTTTTSSTTSTTTTSTQSTATTTTLYPWWLATGIVSNTCIYSGLITDTHADDGNYLILDECAKVPGFDHEFTFENVPDIPGVGLRFNGYYDGSLGHDIVWYIWNYNTVDWDKLTDSLQDIPRTGSPDQDFQWHIDFTSGDYLSGGQLKLQLVHETFGSLPHKTRIDYLWLDISLTTSTSTTTSTSSSTSSSSTTTTTVTQPLSVDVVTEFDVLVEIEDRNFRA